MYLMLVSSIFVLYALVDVDAPVHYKHAKVIKRKLQSIRYHHHDLGT